MMSQRDVGQCAIRNFTETYTELNYNTMGSTIILHKAKQQRSPKLQQLTGE
jgi:hypothetical protein